MKKIFTLVLVSLAALLQAQVQVGHTTITFADPSRNGGFGSGGGSGRQIQTEIYYPAAIAGDDVPILGGNYPVIVFGHGFVMVWSAYQNVWDAVVPEGYIIAFPRTEGSISPSHGDFGLDLAYVAEQIQTRGVNDPNFFFYQKTAPTTALMGHSMGGGAALLGSQNNANITAMAVLAAAETNPSAVAAAPGIKVPSLIFSGGNDCVTPAATNQLLMYNALASKCKTHVTITGGSHCQFADDNFNCGFGEATCSPSPTISRGQQHTSLNTYLIPFLNKYLKGTCTPNSNFDGVLASGTDITYTQNCISQAGSNAIVCSGIPTTLGSTIMDGYTFNWTSNPAGFTSTIATPQINPQATTTYILNYTNLQSNCSVIDSVTVTVNPTPAVAAGVNTTLCTSNTLSIGMPTAPNVSYSWNPTTDLSSSSVSNPQFSTATPGNYQYILTATGTQGGCVAKDTININVLQYPAISAQTNTTLCPGAPAQLGVTVDPFVPNIYNAASGSVSIADFSPAGGVVANNTVPTLNQLNASANKTVTIPAGFYRFVGITVSVSHSFNADLDMYLVAPNNQVFVVSTDNGGNGDGYTNVTFTDAAPSVPPTGNTTFNNVSYKPEGAAFITYTGAVAGNWRLYVVDDGLFNSGSIEAFTVNVLELPNTLGYNWTPAAGLDNAAIATPISTDNIGHVYTVTMSYLGCTAADSVTVNRFALPTVNAGTDTTLCNSALIQLGPLAEDGSSYSWQSAPAGFTANTAQIIVEPSVTTSYYLTVIDANTCSNTDTVVVVVNPTVPPTITADGPLNFCIGTSVSLQANETTNLLWLPGGETSQSITVTESGAYSVISNAGSQCADTSVAVTVVVFPNPTIITNENVFACNGSSVTLLGPANFVSYLWQPGQEQTQNIVVPAGEYNLIATDSNGCSGVVAYYNVNNFPQSTLSLSQLGDSLFAQPDNDTWQYQWYYDNEPIAGATEGIYLPNQEGDYYVIATDANGCQVLSDTLTFTKIGINNTLAAGIRIYPNPAYDAVFITMPATVGKLNLTVISATGQVVQQNIIVDETSRVSLDGLPAGIYSLRLQQGNKQQIIKLVKAE